MSNRQSVIFTKGHANESFQASLTKLCGNLFLRWACGLGPQMRTTTQTTDSCVCDLWRDACSLPKRLSAHTKTSLCPNSSLPKRLCPNNSLPKRLSAQTALCPNVSLPKRLSAQTALCPNYSLLKLLSASAQTALCPNCSFGVGREQFGQRDVWAETFGQRAVWAERRFLNFCPYL